MKKFVICFIMIISFFVFNAQADTGESGVPVLMMDSYGARAIALGDTFTGIADDINTISVNPAGLGSLNSFEASSMYMKYTEDMMFGYLAVGTPLPSDMGYVAGSVCLFSTPDFDHYDASGNINKGALSASDFGLSIGYANNPLKLLGMEGNLNTGFVVKYIQSKLVDDSQTAIGFDFGALYKMNFINIGTKDISDNLGIGISLQNLGSSLKYGTEDTTLPQNMRIGIGYNGYKDNSHSITLGFDVNIPNDSSKIISTALEYSYIEMIFARVGYKITGTEVDGLSFGVGGAYSISGKKISIDYALVSLNDFDSVHTFSAGVKF